MRRAALYGVPGYGAEWQKCYSALLVSLQDRFGAKRVWQRSNKYYDPEDVADDVAVAIIQGLRGGGIDYLRRNLELNIPTLVVDLGWLRRERGYWQVSLGGLNVIPNSAPSSDRFEALNLKVEKPTKKNYAAVVIGQMPGDAQHDLATDRDMMAWGKTTADEAKKLFPKKRLFWRPHPRFNCSVGRSAITTSSERSLFEFVNDEHVGSAVVYNSTAGLELLRQGVNVVALGPRTVYTDLVTSDLSRLEDSHPGPAKVRELLERIAYAQYKTEELSRWETLERLFQLHNVTGDW